MRLYRIRQYGSREGLQRIEEPSPPEPTGRQVLMRVRASSLNFRDLGDLKGYLQAIPPGTAMAWDARRRFSSWRWRLMS
jgi:NADPH:quinone reductase-like Zn-dependent oxidoreductase